jgi:cytochrome oxidase Cu insertion factor (SCO1/SenC/PrrC family)
MSPRPLIAVIASMLVFGLSSVAGVVSALETFRPLPPGNQHPAPAFTLPDHHGTPLHSTDLHGKVVVVRFWATW